MTNSRLLFKFKMSLVDLEKARQNPYSLFTEELENTVVSELIHLKSHLATLDAATKPTNPISLCQWQREKLHHIYPNVDIDLRMFISPPTSNCRYSRTFFFLIKTCQKLLAIDNAVK